MEQSDKLLTFDPGGLTGYSVWELKPEGAYLIETGDLEFDSLELPFIKHTPTYVAFEVVRVTHPSVSSIGVEVIGVLKFLCRSLKITYTEQYPNQMKGPYAWPDTASQIKAASKSPHARDALSHACLWLTKRNYKIFFQTC